MKGDTTVQTQDGVLAVCAHRAVGAERERRWSRWAAIDGDLDELAATRSRETAVFVFAPTPATAGSASA